MLRRFADSRPFNFLYELTSKTLLMRNEGSLLGFLGYLLEPLLEFAILVIVFSHRLGQEIELYPLYLLIGIIHWELLAFGVQRSIVVIVQNASLIRTLPIRLELFVLSGLLVAFITYLINMVLFVICYLLLGGQMTHIWLIPVVLASELLLVAGLGFGAAALYVYVRDIQNVWLVLQRAWWFLTPVFYTQTYIVGVHHTVSQFNPMYHILDNMRALLVYGKVPTAMSLLIPLGIGLFVFCIGIFVFRILAPRCPELV